MIRENGGWDNFTMTLVKYFKCNTKRELEAEEELMRRKLNATLNTNMSYRTEQDKFNNLKNLSDKWRQQNPEYNKEYYYEHRQKVLEQKAKKVVCSCGMSMRKDSMTDHKKSKFHLKWEASC